MERLANGDPEVWGEAFRMLFPVACEAAQSRLDGLLAADCEDVAIETLCELLTHKFQTTSELELKALVAAIARNKATDRLRRTLAEKRGGNKLQSFDAILESGEEKETVHSGGDFLDSLTLQELRLLLKDLSEDVKKEYRIVLRDHFFDQLSYSEIATKRKISIGSVGVYLQRGLASLRSVIAKRPNLKEEFISMVSDRTLVGALLPLATAVQLGGWFLDHTIRYQRADINEETLSDLNRLRMAQETINQHALSGAQQSDLIKILKGQSSRYFHQQELQGNQASRNDGNVGERLVNKSHRIGLLGILAFLCAVIGFLFVVFRLIK
jgi:RNA polymerase sigma factor (sigma-70 family)